MEVTSKVFANTVQPGLHSEKDVFDVEDIEDPRDPLRWNRPRKYRILFAVCLAAFTGLVSSTTLLSGLVVQAQTYNVTPTQMSYSVSALIAGLMVGPVIIVPVSKAIGTSSTILWCNIGLLITSIWSANMTRKDQYIPFVISRLTGGLFGSIAQILGNSILMDIFVLKERGRAFAVYAACFTLATTLAPTLSGFVVSHTTWPVQFWWTIGVQGVSFIVSFFFLEETGLVRNGMISAQGTESKSWMANRVETFLPGTAVVPKMSARQVLKAGIAPFVIISKVVAVCCCLYEMIAYGFMVIQQTLLAIFLQEPFDPLHGRYGYGFSPSKTLFIYGLLVNDRLPLHIASRTGHWYAEYRLHSLWVPGLICLPIGLGLFGASLQYHLHWGILGVGSLLIAFAGAASAPVPINYLSESYAKNSQDVGTVLNIFRLLLGLVVPFFIAPWEAKVGVGWVFGTAALFGLGTFALVVMVMIWGQKLRGAAPQRFPRQQVAELT